MKNHIEIFEKIGKLKIVPVVVLEKADAAKSLGEILVNNNLPCAEVTFRTSATVKILNTLRKNFPSMLLGAGTVLTSEDANKAMDAGASFIVSPGFDPKLVEYCLNKNYPVVPGVATASEIQVARSMGLKVLKFFPASNLGGITMIKTLSAPFRDIQFLPTGGINKDNILEFLALESVIACGGTWLVKKSFLENSEFEKIEKLVSEAVKLVKSNSK